MSKPTFGAELVGDEDQSAGGDAVLPAQDALDEVEQGPRVLAGEEVPEFVEETLQRPAVAPGWKPVGAKLTTVHQTGNADLLTDVAEASA